MAFKEAMGVLSVILMFLAYGIYIWHTMREDGVRPHPFSWFLWGFVTGVVYLVQVSQRAGAGSWVVGFSAVICFLIGGISFFKEKWRFSFFDWFCLLAGLAIFAFYLLRSEKTRFPILLTNVLSMGVTGKPG